MTGIVHVRHLAACRHVPHGGRKEQLGFVEMTTPVTLPEADPGEIEVATVFTGGGYTNGIPIHAHGGALWLKARGDFVYQPDGTRAPAPYRRADFLSGLSGMAQPAILASGTARSMLTGTPLIPSKGALEAGLRVDLGRSRRVVDDGREQAARDIARFVREDVLLAGDDVYVRLPGPLLHAYWDTSFLELGYAPFPRSWQADFPGSLYARADRAREFWDMARREVAAQGDAPPPDDAFRALPYEGIDPSYFRDDDIVLIANDAPRRTVRQVDLAIRDGATPDEKAVLREAARPVEAWLGRGLLGAIPLAEAEAALACCHRTLEVVGDIRRVRNPPRDFLARWIGEVALPRLRGPEATDEADLEALGDLRAHRM